MLLQCDIKEETDIDDYNQLLKIPDEIVGIKQEGINCEVAMSESCYVSSGVREENELVRITNLSSK